MLNVRKREQKRMQKEERLFFKHGKRLLHKKIEKLKEEEAKKELEIWIEMVKESNLKELKEAITAFTNWKEEICNSKLVKYTNGYTEGCNYKIKVLKRNAYGYKNFERFRNRILHIFDKKNLSVA